MATLCVTADAAEALERAYDRALPMEACGFLLGGAQDGRSIVTEIVTAGGLPGYRNEFEIPDHELHRMRAYAQDRSLRILALFHSHPSGERSLSTTDRAALRYSAWPWVIVTRPKATAAIVFTAYAPGDATQIGVGVDRSARRGGAGFG
jgi:proteasome lid subunit RPN8/RPN11